MSCYGSLVPHFNPETIDLAMVAAHLSSVCGSSVQGAVVGRTLLRDEVSRHLACSQLDAELIVDTMVGRGFLVRRDPQGGLEEWFIPAKHP